MTPLLTASYEGHNELVELLLEYDADIVYLPFSLILHFPFFISRLL